MPARQAAACGSWASPLSAAQAVSAAVGLSDVQIDGDRCLWQEGRPAERGRSVVVQWRAGAEPADRIAPPWSARTRAHEYGGRAYLMADGVLFFNHDADQRLYRVGAEAGAEPRPITPEAAWRFADLCLDRRRGLLWCVREDHRGAGEPHNELVALHAAGDDDGGRVVVSGPDFVAAPRLSPDGRQLAWLAWHHPDMPWDGCELWLAEVDDAGTLHGARCLAGGRDESVQQPQWSPDGVLHFVSDAGGWWNLRRWRDGRVEALCPMAAEFGEPFWNFGLATYGFASARQLVCAVVRDGRSVLGQVDTDSGRFAEIATPFSSIGSVAAADGVVLFTGASPLQPASVCRLDLARGQLDVLRCSSALAVAAEDTAVAEAVTFPTGGGQAAHAFFYAPKHRAFVPLPGEKPPLIVMSHGGPTSRALDAYRPAIQFWTSRGFAVLDVNYRGSSGFGRAYRQQLDGRWGEADVDDCCAGARFLAARGDVDPARLIIRGGSAGGFTTLCALTFRDTFACGASLYGIGDLEALARDTHKFEAHYLDRLVGTYPAQRERYRQRSPIHHVDRLRCPLILLQGAEDRVVPPEQSRRMHAALKAKGVPVAYLEFEGEQHGFRSAANIVRALEAEATFYARVFGFELADAVPPLAIDNL